MRQFRPLVFVLLVVLAFGAVVAASASARKATPGITPSNVLFTDKSGVSVFAGGSVVSGSKVECATSESTGGFLTSLTGTFDLLFLGCLVKITSVLYLCTGSNDKVSSSILVLGTFVLRYREPTPSTKTVAAFLITPVKFECVASGSPNKTIEVMGCAAGEVTPVNKAVVTGEHFTVFMTKSASADRNEITKIETETGSTEETCQLLANENGGTFKEAAEGTTDEIVGNVSSAEIQA